MKSKLTKDKTGFKNVIWTAYKSITRNTIVLSDTWIP